MAGAGAVMNEAETEVLSGKLRDESNTDDRRTRSPGSRGGVAVRVGRDSLELIEEDRFVTVLLHDPRVFQDAVGKLRDLIETGMAATPRRRLIGLILLHRGIALSSRTSEARLKELAQHRIMLRTSPTEDIREGARKIKQEVMEQYEIASQNAGIASRPLSSSNSA
jgi:hypothetical protein